MKSTFDGPPKTVLAGLATVILFFLMCCGDSGPRGTQPSRSSSSGKSSKAGLSEEEAAKRARETYQSVCMTCHGMKGKGDGLGAAALDPKPRDYTDAEWQKTVTDEHLKKVIVYGGAAGGLNANMPAHPLLKGQDEVLDALVDIIRGFGKGEAASNN